MTTPSNTPRPQPPLLSLAPEDLEFVTRFVLTSGSLKEMAQSYGVSYPTIRAKLDRLIERLEALRQGRTLDPMVERVADLVEKGEVTPSAARAILDLWRREHPQTREN